MQLQKPQARKINKNLLHLRSSYMSGARGVVLEGGSRSGKTYSSVDFLIMLATRYSNGARQQMFIIKETYNSFKTTLFEDFRKRLPEFGIKSKFDSVEEIHSVDIYDLRIHFLGADKPSVAHGAGSDFLWLNEPLPISKYIFDQYEQRCRKFWWMDLNPSISDHWIFNLEKREEVKFLRTTMLDNPFIPAWQKKKILSYNPNDPENVRRGTADDYMWAVYGEGKRASPQGLVYPNVTWIQDFPEGIEDIIYGMDFGYTNSPTAIVKIGRSGQNLFLKLLCYEPFEDPQRLSDVIKHVVGDGRIWADSADPQMISNLRRRGCSVFPVVKKEDSVRFGISKMKEYKIHIVNDADFRKEAENYKWMEIHGIRVNEPVKAYDHAWDAARYGVMMEFRGGE